MTDRTTRFSSLFYRTIPLVVLVLAAQGCSRRSSAPAADNTLLAEQKAPLVFPSPVASPAVTETPTASAPGASLPEPVPTLPAPGPSVIVCNRAAQHEAQEDHYVLFTPADCGGVLPDSLYVGAVARLEVNGGYKRFMTLQPGRITGSLPPHAGIVFTTIYKGFYAVRVLYVRRVPGMVFCSRAGAHVPGSNVVPFQDNDCGPAPIPTNAVGLLSGIDVPAGVLVQAVLNPGESRFGGRGPGVGFYSSTPPEGGLGLHRVEAIFLPRSTEVVSCYSAGNSTFGNNSHTYTSCDGAVGSDYAGAISIANANGGIASFSTIDPGVVAYGVSGPGGYLYAYSSTPQPYETRSVYLRRVPNRP